MLVIGIAGGTGSGKTIVVKKTKTKVCSTAASAGTAYSKTQTPDCEVAADYSSPHHPSAPTDTFW